MNNPRYMLRASARRALVEQGYQVELSPGRGLGRGARLAVKKGTNPVLQVAVRTSLKADVGLLRNAAGGWRTIPGVDLVVVAVPSAEILNVVDVLAFDPAFLMRAFEVVTATKENNTGADANYKTPVFIGLDQYLNIGTEFGATLRDNAMWKLSVTASVPAEENHFANAASSDLMDRLKTEIANFLKVDVNRVSIEIRIQA